MNISSECRLNRSDLNWSTHLILCIPPGSLNWVPALARGKGRNVPSARWQVTLCDPVWHVSSRSGVAMLHCKLLYPYTTLLLCMCLLCLILNSCELWIFASLHTLWWHHWVIRVHISNILFCSMMMHRILDMFDVNLGVTVWSGNCGMPNRTPWKRFFTTHFSRWVIIHMCFSCICFVVSWAASGLWKGCPSYLFGPRCKFTSIFNLYISLWN